MKSAPHSLRFVTTVASIALIIASIAIAGGFSSAQDTSSAPHPAYLQEGSCPAPGVIDFDLQPLSDEGLVNGTPFAQSPPVGQSNSVPIQESDTTVGLSLSELADSDFAIVISESAANTTTYLVCGNIGGAMFGPNDLTLSLAPVNDSGYIGVATLHDNGDGTTAVYLFLMQPSAAAVSAVASPVTGQASPPAASPITGQAPPPAASPIAGQAPPPAASPSAQQPAPTPAAAGGAQTAVTIDMVDLAFQPNAFTIPANTNVTVTLNNTGALPHNFSITDHNNPNVQNLNISVDVQPGQTQTVTINAPAGAYYFFCDVPGHEAAGMFGTMTVQ